MGLSFEEVAKGWVDFASGICFCVVNGAKFLYVANIGS
jgi:hypothetical protein